MTDDPCRYCGGDMIVGWSNGPIPCPECSAGIDDKTLLENAWRRERMRYKSEHELTKTMDANFSAARSGVLKMLGELHEHLEFMFGAFAIEDVSRRVAIESALTRASPYRPTWELAQAEIQKLGATASEVLGLSATLYQAKWERDRALGFLREFNRGERQRSDVTEFLNFIAECNPNEVLK